MTKIALVTGAGSGIGRNATIALTNAGYRVVATGRRLNALEETAAFCPPDSVMPVPCDVTSENSVDSLFAVILEKFGRLDVVFNNAGNNVPTTNFGDLKLVDWNHVMNVNLTGAFLIANRSFKLMKAQSPQGGRIINNGSISAHVPRPGSAPYTSSKHAISGMTKTIALDGREFSIACGQIDIGNAASEMTAKMEGGVPQADGSMKPESTMNVDHVGDAIVNMAALPLDANILTMTIMSTNMPFVGRG